MGRLTASSPRMRLRETAAGLDKHFKMALKDTERHAAFEALIRVWDDESAAAIYQMSSDGVYSALDLLNLQSSVDNRREIIKLREEYEELHEALKRLS
jgi:hypothetical protein